ncbi:MAG: SusD/RagB family nutrient-binding outer membrane lipoprotein [Bacteroidota bacterium]
MKNIFKNILLVMAVMLASCESLVEDINLNPNNIAVDEVAATSFLTGIMLANTSVHVSHSNRISGLWTGQLVGYTSLYSNIYGYNISTAESIDPWARIYIAIIPNARHMQGQAPDDALLNGITKTIEAMAVSTGASIFGDVPYSQVNSEVEDPAFESQVSVLNATVALLDEAIADLNNASSRAISEDIYYGGDADKWLAAAFTTKARIHMWMRDYSSAYAAAQNGISSSDGNLQFLPTGDPAVFEGNKNLFFQPIAGSRAGDIGSRDSYMMSMLDADSPNYRGNAKTDETAREGYYTILDSDASENLGFANLFEPQDIVSFQENHLILAEAGARTIGFDRGLQHLNEYRVYLNDGGDVNANFQDLPHVYEAYVADDFSAGGLENADNVSADKALLREIIEERYISGFGMFMPFDDARRLRKGESDLIVPFPLNTNSASQYPERFPYSDDELNTNSNAPGDDPGIFTKTEVNQ